MHPVLLRPFNHHNRECIGIYFSANAKVQVIVKKIRGVKWSRSFRCWYLPLEDRAVALIAKSLAAVADADRAALDAYVAKKKELESTGPRQTGLQRTARLAFPEKKNGTGSAGIPLTDPQPAAKPRTTLIYLHTSNRDLLRVLSPLEDLNLF